MTASNRPSPLSTIDPWNWVAQSYVELTAPKLMLYAEEALAAAELSVNHRVLDVAAGPGTLACHIAPNVSHVTTVDFSPEMVALCRARVAGLGLSNVTVHEGDGQCLALPSASFERAFSFFGLMFFPCRGNGFAELFRVLVPGGMAFVTSWAPISESPLMSSMIDALRVADPTVASAKSDLVSLENPERFEQELRDAGFVDVVVRRVFKDWGFTTFDELFDRMLRGSAPLEVMKRKVSTEEWERRVAVMRNYLFERFGEHPTGLGSTAWLGQGRRP
jgi:ubiquinone/menaquinone biosynthesis C-methylase UbiE